MPAISSSPYPCAGGINNTITETYNRKVAADILRTLRRNLPASVALSAKAPHGICLDPACTSLHAEATACSCPQILFWMSGDLLKFPSCTQAVVIVGAYSHKHVGKSSRLGLIQIDTFFK